MILVMGGRLFRYLTPPPPPHPPSGSPATTEVQVIVGQNLGPKGAGRKSFFVRRRVFSHSISVQSKCSEINGECKNDGKPFQKPTEV